MSPTASRLEIHPLPGHGAEDVVVVPDGPHEGSVLSGTEDGAMLGHARCSRKGARYVTTSLGTYSQAQFLAIGAHRRP